MKQMLLCILFWLTPVIMSNTEASVVAQQNSEQINNFYQLEQESLPYDNVMTLTLAVVTSRDDYDINIVAKAFAMLSEIATNRGELNSAFQFGQFGTELSGIDAPIRLNLMLKVAGGYYAQGKFQQLKQMATKALWLAQQVEHIKYQMQALGYLAVAHALTADHQSALVNLSKVEQLLESNPQFADHISLLEILSEVHLNLGEHLSALLLLNKVVKLRLDMQRTHRIGRTYQQLARAYFYLEKYDDAYNAYWQAKKYALEKNSVISAAYAELGLGEVLFKQGQYSQAKEKLIALQTTFANENISHAYLSNLIVLVKVLFALDENDLAISKLMKAAQVAQEIELTADQIDLYLLLTRYYVNEQAFEKALNMQSRYLALSEKFIHTKSFDLHTAQAQLQSNTKSQQLALNLAEQSDLSLRYSKKYQEQNQVIFALLTVAMLLVGLLAVILLKQHRRKLNNKYEELELPQYLLASPVQTKNWYQLQYKMARKYQYEIAVGYLIIENWQELTFHFKAKTLNEISKTIATAINQHMDEFDYRGVINSGEFLLLCPYQSKAQLEVKLLKIEAALKVKIFANLGHYSVKIRFAFDSPNIQDIDPYIFLSRLSEFTQTEFVS